MATDHGGVFDLGERRVRRMGYGAMRLAGPSAFGPPHDAVEAVAVLREAVAQGVDHIDTSDYYGPYVVNDLIRQALHPYPAGLTLVTKVGYRRGDDRSWIPDPSRETLIASVHENLERLRLDSLDVVNLRLGGPDDDVETPLAVLADLQSQGLIRNLGVSNVSAKQVRRAQGVAEIVCVQNRYSLVHRVDDALIDALAAQGIAYTPFYPLSFYSPAQTAALETVARQAGSTPMQTALAWMLRRSPNILLIPGTSSRAHLAENLAAPKIVLSEEMLAALNAVAAT
jgi:pyridoxine 4-dehydrogenase